MLLDEPLAYENTAALQAGVVQPQAPLAFLSACLRCRDPRFDKRQELEYEPGTPKAEKTNQSNRFRRILRCQHCVRPDLLVCLFSNLPKSNHLPSKSSAIPIMQFRQLHSPHTEKEICAG